MPNGLQTVQVLQPWQSAILVSAKGTNNKGMRLLNQKKYQQAVAKFKEAIKSAEYEGAPFAASRAIAYSNLGLAYKTMGEYDLASKALLQSIRLNPLDYPTTGYLALVYFLKNEYENARNYYMQAKDIAVHCNAEPSELANIWYSIASSEYYAARANSPLGDDPDSVIKLANKSLSFDRKYVPALILRAKVYYENKQYDLALQDAENAAKIATDKTEALYLQGKIHARTGDLAAAKYNYLAATRRDNNSNSDTLEAAAAHYKLGKLYDLKEHAQDSAATQYQQAIKAIQEGKFQPKSLGRFILAQAYRYGRGVEQDLVSAKIILQKLNDEFFYPTAMKQHIQHALASLRDVFVTDEARVTFAAKHYQGFLDGKANQLFQAKAKGHENNKKERNCISRCTIM